MLTQIAYLVGGLGTRLGDRTGSIPKPLLDVGGKPFIEYLLDEAARQAFTDILLLAGYLGHQVAQDYHGRSWRGARVRVISERAPLGTGGALRAALPELADQFVLANGDSFFDINLRALTLSIPARGIVLALRSTAADLRYGRVTMSGGHVSAFHAPQAGREGPINAGIYALKRAVVDAMPEGKGSLENDIFPDLAHRGLILGRCYDSYFIDIGVPADFERAQIELPARVRRPAIFFDRDGVLNEDRGYVHHPRDFVWLPGAKEAIRLCNDRGYFVFVVTNQAGVAHGYYSEAAIQALHHWMNRELAAVGAHIDAFEYCPHHPSAEIPKYRISCRRRKPGSGMIQDLMTNWPVDLSRSFLVGDTQSDLDAAKGAGIPAYLYEKGDLRNFIAERQVA